MNAIQFEAPVQAQSGEEPPFLKFRFAGLFPQKEGKITNPDLQFLEALKNKFFVSFEHFHDEATGMIVSKAEEEFVAYSWGVLVPLAEPLEIRGVCVDSYWYLDYIGASTGQSNKGFGTTLLKLWQETTPGKPILLGDVAAAPSEVGIETPPPDDNQLKDWYQKNGFLALDDAEYAVWRAWIPPAWQSVLTPREQEMLARYLVKHHLKTFVVDSTTE